MKTDEKLTYLGERTISRLGCFGCHNIRGFEGAKPIGTPLNGWGLKNPMRLDFAHISEYFTSQALGEEGERDGTPEFYQEKLAEHDRMGFLYQKVHRPRSYDYKKDREDILAWDERLRMPQFSWADDREAVEEVMTFVLGLTGEIIPAQYLPHYDPPKQALAQGERLLERYNCRGCHTLAMPKYTIAAGANLDSVFKGFDASDPNTFQANVGLSYDNRAKDYLSLFHERGLDLEYEAGKAPELGPPDPGPVTIEGMPTFVDVQEDDQGKPVKTVYVQVWRPVTIRGYTFNVGDTVLLDPDKVQVTPAEGGNFAWLYSAFEAQQTGEPMPPVWNKLPPPLLREGLKVQTPWLTGFLLDPEKIRPAAQLRMPRFHYGSTPPRSPPRPLREEPQAETRDLANYFAARDGAVFPYQEVPQREQQYLASRESIFAGTGRQHASASESAVAPSSKYLAAGWELITKNQCVQCHTIGQYQPTGEPKTFGPDLRNVHARIRPDYMLNWIAQPTRTLPYTAMPQVFLPTPPEGTPPLPGVPKQLDGKPLEQIQTVRDTLMNFVTTVEQQLAKVAPPPEPPPATAPRRAARARVRPRPPPPPAPSDVGGRSPPPNTDGQPETLHGARSPPGPFPLTRPNLDPRETPMTLWKSLRTLAPLGLLAALAGCGGGDEKTDTGVVVVTEPGKLPAAGTAGSTAPTAGEGAAATEKAGGEAPAAAATASGWGTLKGKVTFEGDPPKPEVLVAQGATDVKDAAVCAKNAIVSEKLVVDPESKGVKWAIVYIPKPTAVNPEAESEAQSAQVEFDQNGCTFEPHALAVMKGATVLIKSSDQAGHNVHTQLRFTNFNQGIQPGTSAPLPIKVADNRPGPVICDIHNWMKAWWLTLNNPYFAVTNEKGEYEIKNVPAGEQKVVVWTEATNLLTPSSGEPVTIKADDAVEKDYSFSASQVK